VAVDDAGKARKRALDIRLQVRSALAKIHKAETLKSATSSKNGMSIYQSIYQYSNQSNNP
jgi:hypothetical protein